MQISRKFKKVNDKRGKRDKRSKLYIYVRRVIYREIFGFGVMILWFEEMGSELVR